MRERCKYCSSYVAIDKVEKYEAHETSTCNGSSMVWKSCYGSGKRNSDITSSKCDKKCDVDLNGQLVETMTTIYMIIQNRSAKQ